MSSGLKCKNCGSSDIEVDSARGDAVCTACGSVLEDNIIVSEVQFEEAGHGTASAVGQFVSADSKGGATGYGKFHVGMGTESREVTLRKARQGITHLSHQLHLNNHCIETACNFFKMALMRHLTRGRKNTHTYAACVYITCRTEGTCHLLIDISDVLQICCYELGRTYLKLSQALCINIPSIDPCLYIMRFANKMELGEKTHEVSMTAQRLVQRMMKDSIHSGRPSGLCGAALLIAARMHDYSRKRLIEFGDTPSSMLTLDEFMAVDLEAEQDPPAFKAARKRDRERLQKLSEHHEAEFSDLQMEIDSHLEKELKNKRKGRFDALDAVEHDETDVFIRESTLDVINECLADAEDVDDPGDVSDGGGKKERIIPTGLKPDLAALCLPNLKDDVSESNQNQDGNFVGCELDLEGLDDEEINGYIMTEAEAKYKDVMWNRLNAEYLKEAKAKEEKLAKEKEEGKPEKKRRRNSRKKNIGPSNTAGEAIEKMLQEKKISNKINYDILKTLTEPKSVELEVLIWAQEQCEERSPNLTRFTEHFNKMSYWARSQILKQEDSKDREKHVIKFIKIMKHLRKINNFNSYLALLSALDSAPIRRLEWHRTITDGLKEYCALIDSSSSFRAYRQALGETNPPCIPYIGLVLQDLTFVHIGNQDFLNEGVINFSKRWQQHNIVVNMKRFKKGSSSYPFKKNERIIGFFDNFENYLDEDAMWQISENLKPRVSRKAIPN